MKKVLLIGLLVSLFFFGGLSLSQYEGFGGFSSTLLDESSVETGHLYMTVTGGAGNYFFVQVTNSGDQDITGRIVFFDQVITDEGESNVACSYNDSTGSNFASNMSWDTGSFLVPAGSGITKTITLDYNYCSSGANLGCAVITEEQDRDLGDIDVLLGVPSFVDIQVSLDDVNCSKYTVMSIPSQRFGNLNLTGFLSYWITGDRGTITASNAYADGTVGLDDEGIGQFMYDFPSQGSGYMFLFKPRSYLSVGYTGNFDISSTGTLDFTNRIGLDSRVYGSGRFNTFYLIDLPESQGFSGDRSLLVPGDLNNNDYIGAADLAIINYNLTVNFSPVPFEYDLDNDEYITSKDQAIMIQNVTRNGFWRYFINSPGSGYTLGDDVYCKLISEWKFDGNLLDSIGSNDGSYVGVTPNYVQGIDGQALKLDNSEYVSIADDTSLDLTDNFTIGMWAKSDVQPGGPGNEFAFIVNKKLSAWTNPEGYMFYYDSVGAFDFVGNGNNYESYIFANDLQWHYFVATMDNGDVTLYIDGAAVTPSIDYSGGPLSDSSASLSIGAMPWIGYGTKANYDDLILFNRALTAQEVTDLYDIYLAGNAGDCTNVNVFPRN